MAIRAMALWGARRWAVAAAGAAAAFLALAVPTDVVDTPWFGRDVPPTWWSMPVIVASAVLGGLLLATFVSERPREPSRSSGSRAGGVGGLLSFFAVGCPVCNKLVLAALGTSGALTWFSPLQPVLGAAGVALLAWTLSRRLRGAAHCGLVRR